MAGSNFQVFTASIAFSSRPSPRLRATRISRGLPSGPTTSQRTQVPWYFALRASSEYSGSGWKITRGALTPPPTWKNPPPTPPPHEILATPSAGETLQSPPNSSSPPPRSTHSPKPPHPSPPKVGASAPSPRPPSVHSPSSPPQPRPMLVSRHPPPTFLPICAPRFYLHFQRQIVFSRWGTARRARSWFAGSNTRPPHPRRQQSPIVHQIFTATS